VRNQVERGVRKRERRRIAVLKFQTFCEFRRRLAPRLREHRLREIDSDDFRVWKAACDRKRALPGSGTKVERPGRSRVDRSQRSLVGREMRGITHRVPIPGDRVELLANERSEESPKARAAYDGVRRQARELLAEFAPIQNASR
jgi:hypothetical protein